MDRSSAPDSGLPRPLSELARDFFSPDTRAPGFLGARWLFLRAIGVFYLSVFYSLAGQIRGLMGDQGILPVGDLFAFVASRQGLERYGSIPSLLWLAPNDRGLMALVVLGLGASLLVVANVLPRVSLVVCGVLFVSFVSAAQDFSAYQSEGMLLEATAAAFVLAPRGVRPGFGEHHPASRAARFLVLWECFRIYFESGVAKLASGDPRWRDMTAMDHYYENGPLPTSIGWWAQQLPHGFQAATAVVTLAFELVLVFGIFGPRRVRLVTFCLLTLLQLGIIATANYCFLNYLVLALGFMCLDDEALTRVTRSSIPKPLAMEPSRWRFWVAATWMTYLFYASLVVFAFAGAPEPMSWIAAPAGLLEHVRLANRYGLFARMTNVRYEVEFQASTDGVTYVPYPFKYKPQALDSPPGIFAPYQPRFEWNLWFCAVAEEGVARRHIIPVARRTCPWVLSAEARLAERSPQVIALFREDPLHGESPRSVRTVLWQYWMTDPATLRATGHYWRREQIGTYMDVVDNENWANEQRHP